MITIDCAICCIDWPRKIKVAFISNNVTLAQLKYKNKKLKFLDFKKIYRQDVTLPELPSKYSVDFFADMRNRRHQKLGLL